MTARKKKKKSVSVRKKTGDRGIKKRSSQFVQRIRKYIYAGAVFVLLIVGWYGFRAVSSGSWDGVERYNILLGKEGERVLLVSLSASDKDMLVLLFDPRIMVQVVHGYGEYKVGSLLKLGGVEGLGSALLEDSLSSALGVKIHAYLPISPSDEQIENEKWYKNLWQRMLFSLVGTRVGITDVSRYLEATSSLRPDQIEILPLHESRLAFTKPDVDGADLFYLDPLRLDGYLQDRLEEITFLDENLGVSVINTTTTAGLASSFSRLLLNTGIDVVGVSENSTNQSITTFLIRDVSLKSTEVYKFIYSLIPDAVVEVGGADDFRSDMVVLLGNDYGNFLHEKK